MNGEGGYQKKGELEDGKEIKVFLKGGRERVRNHSLISSKKTDW